jgi:heme-degrading monooxygenase HmoA
VIQNIYRWEVERENQAASLTAWEKTTKSIRETKEGARGSVCIINVDRPTEIITMAKWDELDQWRQFVKTAKSATM